MNRMIFVNLPVTDLAKARAFYTGLGFSINEDFSDHQCAAVTISETIAVMLLVEERFRDFVTGEISNAHTSTEAINGLSAKSRAEVDDLFDKAMAHGGKPWLDTLEEGPMYGRSFTDPDGRAWEAMYMDQDG